MLHINKNKTSKTMGRKAVRWQILTIAFLSLLIGVFSIAGVAEATNYGISISDAANVTEGTAASFTVTLSPAIAVAGDVVTVDYTTVNGSAVAPGDYASTGGTLTFNTVGQATQNIPVPTVNDAVVETTEDFTVTLSNQSVVPIAGNNAVINTGTGTGTITDNDTATFTINDVTVNETAGTLDFTVSLDNALDIPVDIDVTFTDGTATGGGIDYTSTALTASFLANDTANKTVSVPINVDGIVEANETFTASLGAATALGGRTVDTTDTATGTIFNNDAATLNFSWPAFQLEDSGGYVFTVTLDNAVQDGFDVAYTTNDGGATVGDADYTDNDGTLTFAGNAAETQTITVAVTPDTKVEADETFTVLLGALSNLGAGINPINIGVPGAPANGIISNDDQYDITIDDVTVAEDGGSAVFTVSLDAFGDINVLIDYATLNGSAIAGTDYTTTSGTLTISAGSTTGTISVPIIDDALNDGDTIFLVNLSNPIPVLLVNSSDPSGQCTITDNDCDLTLAVSLTGTATGTVVPDVAGSPHTFLCGMDIPIMAIPGSGSVFVQWIGDVAEPLLAETTILLNGDKTVTAEFSDNTFALSLAQSGEGGVSATPPGGGVGVYDLLEGTVVNLAAVESVPGWTFLHWTGGVADSTALNTTVTIDSDRVITAFFITPGIDPDIDNDGDGYTINQGDCNDNDASIYPGAPEICEDGIDQDCNGLDISCSVDNDGDGYTVLAGDCNDNDASIYPGATEICDDGIDQDCDGSDLICALDDIDNDGDGYSESMGDCNDANAAIYPGAKEICGNGVDEDCYDGDRPCGTEEKCVDISDVPLETQIQAAPANIMFVMDDSGSMSSDVMSPTSAWPSGWERKWMGMNAMYYDPNLTYTPWPNHQGAGNLPDADLDNPLTYPVATSQHIASNPFDINSNSYLNVPSGPEYITVQRGGGTTSGWYICADAVRIQGADAATAGIDVIVDNRDLTFSGTGGSTTNWQGGWYDNSYYRMWGAAASATWILPVPVAGLYTVSVYLQDKTYFVNDADYKIYHAGAQQGGDVSINQQTVADGWTALGNYTFAASTPTQATVSFTSYFVWNDDDTDGVRDNDEIYLVDITGSGTTGTISYYRVDSAVIAARSYITNFGQLTGPLAAPPAGIVTGRTYAEERQNFVNWYAFCRTRDMMAKAAVSRVIEDMQNVNIGIHSLQNRVNEPVLPVKVPSEPDGTETLLTALYDDIYPSGMTPLRGAFRKVGMYFEEGVTIGGLGGEPFATAEEGGACQQNFVVLMTDGGYNGTAPTMGNEDIDDPIGDPDSIYDGGCFADPWEKTLADIAMNYYERDLSPTLDNLVPITSMDSARHQHLVTYMISFGVFGTIDPADWPECPSVCPVWPNPALSTQNKIDDMFHAAVNGRGRFLSTGNPQALVDALNAIMNDIVNRIGSGSAVSINSQELHSDTVIFQGIYDTSNWTGDIQAYDLDDDGNIEINYKWSAQEQIALQDWNLGREIITFNGTPGTGGIPFRAADIPAAQLALLNADVPTATAIVNYIRGDDTNEQDQGGTYSFRSRGGKLGDIVHSTPLLFDGVLYVGGNDGMLHAFDENSGNEVFAYVPRIVYQNLAMLTTPNPGYNHKFYIDEAPFIAKVGASDLLVGTFGKGGKGVYCLDITDTSNAELNAADIVKWEYPDSTDPDNSPDPDMGYGFSRAWIVDSYIGSKVVILGNGYQSTNNRAVLYVLDAATGTLLRTIDTGVGDATDCNGLSTPVLIDINIDKKVDYAYAGDLLGNMWKFDLTDSSVANWKVAYSDGVDGKPLFQAKNELGFRQPITMKPDVIRQCGVGNEGYMVLFGTGRYLGNDDFLDTSVQTVYGIWDWADAWTEAGGTGPDKYLGNLNAGSPRMLSNLQGNGALSDNAKAVTLIEQTQVFFGTVTGEDYRVLSDNDISLYSPGNDTGNHAGWYFDLPATSEKTIMDVSVRGGVLFAITTIPSDSPCGAGGESIIMFMDACDGSRLDAPFADINGDGIIDEKDMINIGSLNHPIWVVPTGWKKTGIYYPPAVLSLDGTAKSYYSTSAGETDTTEHSDETKGLFSWKEIE